MSYMNPVIFREVESELQSLGMKLELADPGSLPEGLSPERIETWADEDTLYIYVPPRAQMIDALWHGARAVGRLKGFPPDIEDIRAQALLDSWAYELCRSTTSSQRAMLQAGRIRKRISNSDLDGEARVKAAFAIWSVLTVLANRERDVYLQWLETADPGIDICLQQIIRDWGFTSPATPEDAAGMLSRSSS